MTQKLFSEYFKEISREFKTGRATELTYRPYLKSFIEKLFQNLMLSGENRNIRKIGKPDYTCFKNKIKIGYIETKDVGINIDKEIKSEQIKKYSEGAIPNIVLTDYMRFILIRNQEPILDITLFDKNDLTKGKKIFSEDIIKRFNQLIGSFLDYKLPTIKSPTELAIELSKRAKLLRDSAQEQLEEDLIKAKNNESVTSIYDFYGAFKELIKDATVSDCVDAYSQTITYGLFLSKIGSHDRLSRDSAVTYIPSSIKIIKKIFMNITGDELPLNLSWIVDEIVDLLNSADIKKILDSFVFEGKHYRDPFIHFYEDFLKEYDPKKRKHKGIYYTPEPVVYFITNAINDILKKEFGKSQGFADDSVKVLDFATGTGTFLANSFVLALKEIRKSGLTGIEKDKIKNHLLKDFYGFEILISPYVIAHLKLSLLLKHENYELDKNERVQVYLTNTLSDPSETISTLIGFLKELSLETMMANEVKAKIPILVVMGNPPYFKSSSNNSPWIRDKLKSYKEGLKERRLGNLDDDYVKFIRFAQWKIEQNKKGVVGLITNNSYIDSPTFRKMRESLLKTFDTLFILNLHGNSNINEVCLDGSKDENVFDIKQGVSICVFIKKDEKSKKKKVLYTDYYGLRPYKYKLLYGNSIYNIKWEEVKIDKKFFFFKPRKVQGKNKYSKYLSLLDIFCDYSSGLETKKDEFLINFNREELKQKLNIFISKSNSKQELIEKLKIKDIIIKDAKGKEKYEFNIDDRRNLIRQEGINEKFMVKYLHRPFDYRWIYFNKSLISRPRLPLSLSMLQSNISLCVSRFTTMRKVFSSVLIADTVTDLKYCEYSRGCYFFPLHTFKEDKTDMQKTLDGKTIKSGKQPNFKEEFIEFIKEEYPNKEIKPEEILDYIYAVLHSNKYRKKYQEFLKIDFPRIPFVEEYRKFKKLSELGNQLRELHLMKTNFKRNIAKFEKSGSNIVEFVKYEKDRIYINKEQYFGNINKEIWDFYIGGYQVLDKWLKSRKNRKLSSSEIETSIKIVNILSDTIKLMEKIDKIKID